MSTHTTPAQKSARETPRAKMPEDIQERMRGLIAQHGSALAALTALLLEENWDFVTNQFATSCDYLTFTTIVGYIYNYFLHSKPLATTL